ncbi:SecDF P1 head subdomain-containing protein [Embleya sp. MST-111070]|uniref:SecDF P1 head subdomain-containing protein n=1 Tax=Embleya sp. MST-111070 TaxID=3398231 RepID=UPI003F74196C
MTQPTHVRRRAARSLVATVAVAAVLGVAGCSSDDPVKFKDGDHTKPVDEASGRDFAEARLVPERALDERQLAASAETIRKRASAGRLPVKSVTVRDGALVVRVAVKPSGDDTRQRLAAIVHTGQLSVRAVTAVTPYAPANGGPGGTAAPSGGPECGDPAVPRVDDPAAPIVACDDKPMEKYTLAPAVITGTDVAKAEAKASLQGSGGWEIQLDWTQKGQAAFTTLTADAARREEPTNRVAIVWDGRVLVAPMVRSAIPGAAVISGTYTEADARQLAGTIGSGMLPAGFRVESFEPGR